MKGHMPEELFSVPEDLLPLLTEQLREQMNNLFAVAGLIGPVVREQQGGRYDQYLAIMNQNLYRMLRTVNNLEFLQLPREFPVREECLDLAGLCRELADQTAALARQMEVRFTYESELKTLLTCADAALLRRMALHLISNALRAAGRQGQAGFRLTQARERAILTVWDSGPGMPFDGETESSPRPVEGLGIGLTVAQRIAELHGGALVLEQREERGLRAVVSLPIRPPEDSQTLRSPKMGYDAEGGFPPVLVELSSVLPYQPFLPEDVE